MVAYNFNSAFVSQIEARTKRQTVRAHRRRHARPGEDVQLYTGMRTKQCRKLVSPDPICTRNDEIRIIRRDGFRIELNHIPLSDRELHNFALLDGFDPIRQWPHLPEMHAFDPVELMRRFWAIAHPGHGDFEGVVIYWNWPDG